MTYNDIINIAKKLDKDVQKKIDLAVEERLEILKEGKLTQDEMERMEECLYMSLVIQEYLDGEYEILEEEKALLLEEMEEMYNEYGELLTKAKLEKKLSRKKRMALELMKIREELFKNKQYVKDVNKKLKDNKKNKEKLKDLSSKDKMKDIAKENKEIMVMGKNKKDLPNPDKMFKLGGDRDSGPVVNKPNNRNKNDQNTITNTNNTNTSSQSDSERNKARNMDAIINGGNNSQQLSPTNGYAVNVNQFVQGVGGIDVPDRLRNRVELSAIENPNLIANAAEKQLVKIKIEQNENKNPRKL